MKLDIDWSKEPYIDSENLFAELGFMKAVRDTDRADTGGLLVYYPVGFSLAEKFLRELPKEADVSSVNKPAIEIEGSTTTTHTAESKDVSVKPSESGESGRDPLDKTDKLRMEMKRLSIERQKDAGIFDEKDAVCSMAMSFLSFCRQIDELIRISREAASRKNP